MIFTIIANRLEVGKLKESMKQTENPVQDLQEELEMKDCLTLTELVNDGNSKDTYENWIGNSKLTVFSRQLETTKESIIQKEAMSKIEAELKKGIGMIGANHERVSFARKIIR